MVTNKGVVHHLPKSKLEAQIISLHILKQLSFHTKFRPLFFLFGPISKSKRQELEKKFKFCCRCDNSPMRKRYFDFDKKRKHVFK